MHMKAAAALLVALGLAGATAGAASAAEHITDLDFLKAERCKGLAVGLHTGDTTGLDNLIKAESRSRTEVVMQRADQELTKAKHEAGNADLKDRLSAELSGPCVAYLNGGKEMAGGH
jgi:hypothetical protein